jgi:Fe-S-cluster containining protein
MMLDPNANSRREVATMRVTLHTPDGPIRGQVEVETGPTRLAELVPTALELTNILVARAARKQEGLGHRISCRAGCGACCRQMVCLSPPECFYLADFIDSMPELARTNALARFSEIETRLDSEGMLDPLMRPNYDDEIALEIARKYFFMGMPCPFLIDESCSIHAHRPVVCREYNVISPPELCVDPIRNEVVRVPMPQPLSTPLARLAAELTGTKARLIPLSLTPRWVSQNQDLRDATWAGLDLFTRFLQLLDEVSLT